MRYSEDVRRRALELYFKTRSVTKTIRQLGLQVSHVAFYKWIKKAGLPVREVKKPALETKLNAAYRCATLGECVQAVSREIGFSSTSIYHWIKKYIEGDGLMGRPKKKAADKNSKSAAQETEKDKRIAELEAQVHDLQLDNDILAEKIKILDNVLKKEGGADMILTQSETKAAIVDALRNKHRLPELRKKVGITKSTYYYQRDEERQAKKKEKEDEICGAVGDIFFENKEIYGYRKIKAVLKRQGRVVSEKVVRRAMRQLGLNVKRKKGKKFSTYLGEFSPAEPNLIKRDFRAEKPNEKWYTDITEFSIPAGKVYLSLLIDGYDMAPVAWSIGTSPNAELANTMLRKAIATLHEGEHPILHSDRGCHYRWPEWIRIEDEAGIRRSMSKKGCSPDNAACEGFFGRMKQEMFYGRDWGSVSLEEFMNVAGDYLVWYREERIKTALGNMTPVEYRQSLGFSV